MRKAGGLVAAVLIASTSTSTSIEARAQTSRDPAAAGAAFTRGRDAMRRGEIDAACELFAESVRMGPAPGARLNLADCEEKRGHYASARQAFTDALEALPSGDDRIPFARERIAKLASQVATLVVSLPANAPADAIVTRNGALLSNRWLGVEIPVDPGDQSLSVDAAGRKRSTMRVALASGERRAVVLALGEVDAPSADVKANETRSPKIVPWSLVGGGGALLVFGTVLGIMTLDRASTFDEHCRPGCDAVGYTAAKEGQWMSIASPLSLVAGAALVGSGLYLLFTRQNAAAAWK